MKWSWKIARYRGIDVAIHFTFPLLLLWIGMTYWESTHSLPAVAKGLGLIITLFCCVVLHEFGHALTAQHFGIRTRSITLLPIGGVAAMEGMPEDPRQEMLVALAGPAVNLAIAATLWLWLAVTQTPLSTGELLASGVPFLYQVMAVNLVLALFNLLPAFPMDGGRVLRAAMAMRMDRREATRKAVAVGQFLATGMFVLGLFYNPFLMLIAAFVWLGASAELSMELMHAALFKATAGQASITRYEALRPDENLRRAIDLTLSGTQKHFPVLLPGQPTALLTQTAMLQALRDEGEQTLIGDLHLPELCCIDGGEPMESIFKTMQTLQTPLIGVTQEGQLTGIIDLENVMELINIEEAIIAHHRQQGRRLM